MKLSNFESKMFGKVFYGYRRDNNGLIEIVPEEEKVIKRIFDLYASGSSLEGIQSFLFENGILSPSGREKWTRDVLNKILNNVKYTFGIIDYSTYLEVSIKKEANCRNPRNCSQ